MTIGSGLFFKMPKIFFEGKALGIDLLGLLFLLDGDFLTANHRLLSNSEARLLSLVLVLLVLDLCGNAHLLITLLTLGSFPFGALSSLSLCNLSGILLSLAVNHARVLDNPALNFLK